MGKPAARVGDPTIPHGVPPSVWNPLTPGPGSPNVLIGGKPAWRALSPAMAGALMSLVADATKDAAAAAASAANPTVQAKKLKDLADTVKEIGAIMGSTDTHACVGVNALVVPHGPGVVIGGSSSVMINGLPAARVGDTIQEAVCVNSIQMGEPTVLIGG